MISTDINPLALEDYTIVSGLTQTDYNNPIFTDIMITRDLIPQTKLEVNYSLTGKTDGGDWQYIATAYYDESAHWRVMSAMRSDLLYQALTQGGLWDDRKSSNEN